MIRALVFDFDGLVLDTETPIIDAYGDVYAEDGYAFDRTQFALQIGHADYNFDPWKPYGPEADRTTLEERRRKLNRARLVLQPILPGVEALLRSSKEEGLLLAVASNSSHDWVESHLKRLGLHSFFSFFACVGDAPSPKPEPDLYRLAINQLGCRACESVAFEDSEAGVTAARRAGLWTVAVPNASTQGHGFSEAHLTVASLEEISVARIHELFGK